MTQGAEMLDAPGEKAQVSDFRTRRGISFAEYLTKAGRDAFVELKGLRRQAEPPADVVVLDVKTERPQKPKKDIRLVETLAVVFQDSEDNHPEVLALRRDFPIVPHLISRQEELPRGLCLYERPYAEEKHYWTPAAYLQRIRTWLDKTADGTLHPEDQQLEPFLPPSPWHLVIPLHIEPEEGRTMTLLQIERLVEHENEKTLITQKYQKNNGQGRGWICVTFRCHPQTHGIIRKIPMDLGELHNLCREGGVDLLTELAANIKQWLLEKEFEGFLQAKLIIVLLLPKTREEGGAEETTETRAFLTINTVWEIGSTIGIIDGKAGVARGSAGLIMNPEKPDPEKCKSLQMIPVTVHHFLNGPTAAMMNGTAPVETKMVMIGVGALGSQVLNSFVRAGFGEWTVVDQDLLLPHNLARHLLSAGAVGFGKASAVAQTLGHEQVTGNAIAAIAANILDPGEKKKEVEKAEAEASIIFDMSASVAVARHLGRGETPARRICGFATPSAQGLVILVEDEGRHARLDWLEGIHYRAILENPALNKSLMPAEGSVRIGGSCRDISMQIPQADMALWAGMFAGQAPSLLKKKEATVKTFEKEGDGSITAITTEVEPVRTFTVDDWTIRMDRWVLRKLSEYRRPKLPKETGGVLLGMLDTDAKCCSIITALPSPPDSEEWPTSYIRGHFGLLEGVKKTEAETAGHVTYVGEWHSHPARASTRPSTTDWLAYAALKAQRDTECLPTVMLIIGDRMAVTLVNGTEEENKNRAKIKKG